MMASDIPWHCCDALSLAAKVHSCLFVERHAHQPLEGEQTKKCMECALYMRLHALMHMDADADCNLNDERV